MTQESNQSPGNASLASPPRVSEEAQSQASLAQTSCTQQHIRIGWWSLLLFLSLGLVLEVFHGFKINWYLGIAAETRRLMWTLAHAHGTLLALVHIAFAVSVQLLPQWNPGTRRLASRTLTAAGLLIPSGFLLGGIQIYSGDPGIGILLLPAGAFLLFMAVLLTARASSQVRG